MAGIKIRQTILDMRHDPPERLPGEHNPRAAHAKVLVVLQRQQPELLGVPSTRLSDILRFPRVNAPQQPLQSVHPHVEVVVGAQEPLEPLAVLLPHVLEHEEGLLLGRVAVVDPRQRYQRQIGTVLRWPGRLRGEELDLTGHVAAPALVDGARPRVQVLARRHHTYEQQTAAVNLLLLLLLSLARRRR